MTFEIILGIFIAGIITNNYALIEMLGTGAVIENERSSRKSLIIGAMTTLVMVLATAITWPISEYLLSNVTQFAASYALALASFNVAPVAVTPNTRPPFVTTHPS